jgi:N-acylneuraminate cytidylyltransferase
MPHLAIIPARGGSKGVPGKNLRNVAGKPMIAWSILRARQAESIDTVIVSTDDERIAEVARAHGAEVPFLRPAELATDQAPTEPVIAHALDWYADRGQTFDTITLLQPTSPLRLPGTIDAAFQRLRGEQADSLLGVVENHHFFWRNDGSPEALYDFRNRPRRQDLTPAGRWYRETGSIYVSKAESFRLSRNRLSGSIALYVMDELEGWEVDSEADFAVMEALFSRIPNADRS